MPNNERVWHRSSRCESGHCVEVSLTKSAIFMRNSREPEGVTLQIAAADWRSFLDGIKRGEFSG